MESATSKLAKLVAVPCSKKCTPHYVQIARPCHISSLNVATKERIRRMLLQIVSKTNIKQFKVQLRLQNWFQHLRRNPNNYFLPTNWVALCVATGIFLRLMLTASQTLFIQKHGRLAMLNYLVKQKQIITLHRLIPNNAELQSHI